MMRSLWVTCLVALLMLAFAGGNGAAAHPAGTAPRAEDCRQHAGAKHPQPERNRHGADDAACCCDCLGCLSPALLEPPTLMGPEVLAARAARPKRAASLADRTLPPEPEPPRPAALG